MIGFDFLFKPVEHVDDALSDLFQGAPLIVALGVAFLLGLRHATDPDHLMAVTSLVARDPSGTRSAARLGAVWGAGHATALLVIGLPLILLGAVAQHQLALGLVMIVAFSLGLAATLTALGIAIVHATKLPVPDRVAAALPTASAFAIVCVGVVLTVQAAGQFA